MEKMLQDSRDPVIVEAAAKLATRGRWIPSGATEKAKAELRQMDIVGSREELVLALGPEPQGHSVPKIQAGGAGSDKKWKQTGV